MVAAHTSAQNSAIVGNTIGLRSHAERVGRGAHGLTRALRMRLVESWNSTPRTQLGEASAQLRVLAR